MKNLPLMLETMVIPNFHDDVDEAREVVMANPRELCEVVDVINLEAVDPKRMQDTCHLLTIFSRIKKRPRFVLFL